MSHNFLFYFNECLILIHLLQCTLFLGDSTLSNFLSYRREKLVRDHPNDNAQLLTGVQFQDGVVGKALKGNSLTLSTLYIFLNALI